MEKAPAIAARLKGPGPGRYALPSTVGFIRNDPTMYKWPAYPFGQRLFDQYVNKCIDNSPGPVYFVNPVVTRQGSDGTFAYSILGRQRDPMTFKTPSPGAYCPEKVHPQGEAHAPVYSMGKRTRFRKRDSNPSPSRYCLPKILGSQQPNRLSYPSYSMAGHQNVGSYLEDTAKTPGPGQYNAIEPDFIRLKNPQYSLQGRSKIPGDNTRKPGPGQHSPEKVYINKPTPPKHSLGIRHSEFVAPLFINLF